MKLKNEKYLWMGLTFSFALIIGLITMAPRVFAQAQPEQKEDLFQYGTMFQSVFNFVLDSYVDEIDPEILFEGAMKGLFESLEDPYTVFLTEEDMADFADTTEGQFGGVGLYISKPDPQAVKLREAALAKELEEKGKDFDLELLDPRNREFPDFVEIVSPIEDTPAFRAGLMTGDYITKINDEPTNNLSIDEVVNRLRGEAGTTVTVTILRHGTVTFDVDLKRAMIEVPTVKHAMLKEHIGYLRIIQFTPYTADRVKEALADFKDNEYDSLIIDLRNNPGGLLDAVVKTADFFFEEGTIVSTRSRIKSENRIFEAKKNTLVPQDIPMVVLIDEGSASASEILAGALGDRDRATLIGNTTYGKGSVQQIIPFGGDGLKITIARYYTPSDVNIDKVGIEPDLLVEEPEMSDEELEDYQTLLQESRINQFIEQTQNPSDSQVENFYDQLVAEGIELEERLIKRMILIENSRVTNDPLPPYDLEYDIILQEAVKSLEVR